MLVLAVESSAVVASVCLMEDQVVRGAFSVNVAQKHSRTLMPMVGDLLARTGISVEEIDLFAVSEGPGSFTGVRIGISCVKGLAFAQEKDCVGVSSLAAMSYNLECAQGVLCAVMDARCGQVYNALFSAQNGKLSRLTQDRALPIEELAVICAQFDQKIFLVGDGAELCCQSEAFQKVEVTLAPPQMRMQNAMGVARAAMSPQARRVSAHELMPVYLRAPQAQRELKIRLEEKK